MTKKKNDCNCSIKCNVETCKYNNCEEGYCELDEIKVGCTCDNDDCCCKEETVCESFKEKKKDKNKEEKEPITDTVYEVQAEDDEEYDYEEEEA